LLLQSVGHAFTLQPIILIALSNSDPTRATAFAAYIQIMRLGGAEIGVALMGTWLRVREQVHFEFHQAACRERQRRCHQCAG
jgi:DHA2 family multidrug resistance protein